MLPAESECEKIKLTVLSNLDRLTPPYPLGYFGQKSHASNQKQA